MVLISSLQQKLIDNWTVTHLYASTCLVRLSDWITLSHVEAVVPYGKSHRIMSIDPSGISFINSKQSPCCKSIIINSPFRIK